MELTKEEIFKIESDEVSKNIQLPELEKKEKKQKENKEEK